MQPFLSLPNDLDLPNAQLEAPVKTPFIFKFILSLNNQPNLPSAHLEAPVEDRVCVPKVNRHKFGDDALLLKQLAPTTGNQEQGERRGGAARKVVFVASVQRQLCKQSKHGTSCEHVREPRGRLCEHVGKGLLPAKSSGRGLCNVTRI